MKRLIALAALILVVVLFLGSGAVYSQATFKIPFKFRAEGKSYPPGSYRIEQKEEGKIALRSEAGDEDVLIPIIERMTSSTQPMEAPQIVFDMVGNFEPSYTEYITEYVLAEIWLTGKDGFLVLATERAEYQKSVKGVKAKK